jgi:hypothetical protein
MHASSMPIHLILPALLARFGHNPNQPLSDLHAIVIHHVHMYNQTRKPGGIEQEKKDQILGIFRKRLKSPWFHELTRAEGHGYQLGIKSKCAEKQNKLLFPSKSCFLTQCFLGRKQWSESERSNATQMRPFRARNDAKQESKKTTLKSKCCCYEQETLLPMPMLSVPHVCFYAKKAKTMMLWL